MKSFRQSVCPGALLLGVLFASQNLVVGAASAELDIQRHEPCNLFDTDEEVRFAVKTKGTLPEKAEAVAILTDENGREVARRTVSEVSGDFEVSVGKPGRGYYELKVSVSEAGHDPTQGLRSIADLEDQEAEESATDSCSLGVMDFVSRTAAEVREGGYVFGLKWWAGIHRQAEMLDAMSKLGLQWTRVIQDEGHRGGGQDRHVKIDEIFNDYPMNAAIKVERFPAEAYDAERYGSMEEYNKRYGKGHWVVKTVPKKEPYTKWLQEQLERIPKEQKVFEIWNEPWDKMSPQEFAEVSQIVADAILEVRPDAIIGPNFAGKTGKYEYDAQVIEAGGMERMKMVALHPYSNPLNRQWFREYKAWLEEKLGRKMEIYITEYGSHSTPEGPQKQSEMKQAVNVAQRSIAIYSNGVEALVPHIAVSSEKNPTYWDDWLGLFRRNEEPKPAIIAHANAARMIDGKEHLGDLWFGPEVEAMVFSRDDENVLVLWTVGNKEIEVAAEGAGLHLTDMIGRETALKAQDGKVKVALGEAPVYLTGFSSELLAEVSKELRPDRWPKEDQPERMVRKVGKLPRMPDFDGAFEDWKEVYEFAFVNEAVNAKDASGFGYIGWDDEYLYVGAKVKDNEVLNKRTLNKLYQQDSIELFVSTEPRETGGGFGPNDRQFFLTPTSPSGEPVIAELVERETGVVKELDEAKYFAGPKGEGWAVEVAIPWTVFKEFKPEAGARLMLDMRLNDADSSHERWKLDPGDSPTFTVHDPLAWAFMELQD